MFSGTGFSVAAISADTAGIVTAASVVEGVAVHETPAYFPGAWNIIPAPQRSDWALVETRDS